jgi:hypothetical protein
MSFVHRVAAFVADQVAPRLVIGKGPRNVPSREQLEREAAAELEARIALGRPGPEEAVRTRPVPAWCVPRPKPTQPLEVVRVRVDAVIPPAPAPGDEPVPTRANVSPKR